MPIANFEKAILRLLAANRNPENFVAGATVLLRDDKSHRRSRDIDLFHDTAESLKVAAETDSAVLDQHGYQVAWDNVHPRDPGSRVRGIFHAPASLRQRPRRLARHPGITREA